MSNANAATDKVIGDGGPEGSSFGKDASAPVGFHGSKEAQVTVSGTELASVMTAFFTSMASKGLYNFTGTLGTDLVTEILRSTDDINFIMDTGGTEESEFSWREGGTTVGTSNEIMYLDTEELSCTVFISAGGGMKSSHPTVGVGYGSGAEGAVTQTTNRTTGVALNKVCGRITTDNTSLAAGAAATFTVTAAAVNIGYIPNVCIRSGATTNQTKVYVTGVTDSGFDITVENNHASTAETGAIIINYAFTTVEE